LIGFSAQTDVAKEQVPSLSKRFTDIGSYIIQLQDNQDEGPSNKRRRIDEETLPLRSPTKLKTLPPGSRSVDDESTEWAIKASPLLQLGDFSFSSPGRKKMAVEFNDVGIVGKLPASGAVETAVKYANIERIICLPVPEKLQPQFNICIFPYGTDGIDSSTQTAAGGTAAPAREPMVFTIPDGLPKTAKGPALSTAEPTSYKQLVITFLNSKLGLGKQVTEPDGKEFSSAIIQAHRKNEKAYFTKAHRGAKEGYMFFLSDGILFGFKKPLLFFSFASVTAISYTSVLQRTFNLNINTGAVSDDEPGTSSSEIEFAMIDQVNFPGIDSYVKRHGLNDASMAESRKAKLLHINGKLKDGEEAAEGSEGEISKVIRSGLVQDEDEELPPVQATPKKPKSRNAGPVPFNINGPDLDDEDEEEEEEDYEPGSGAESEGSGSSDDDDDDDDGDGDDDEDDDMEDEG
jgi:hypothetical protein